MTPNRLRKVRLYPCQELHAVWKRWLAAYRWIYNYTIATLKHGYQGTCFDCQKLVRDSEKPEWVKFLPGHQLQEAVADAFDAFKQANAAGGQVKFKSCRAPSQIIKFKVNNFKNGAWYPRLTKGLTFTSPQAIPKNCLYGTQLKYARGKWYGCFPEYQERETTEQKRVMALDPGVRSFLVGYDGESITEFATNDIGKINRLCYHLDLLMSRISQCKIKRKRDQMRKASHRMRERIRNLVDDLHKKVAHFLVNHYKLIFLPTFNSSQMVLKSRRKLNSKSVKNLLTWSHYRFAKHLMQQAERKGVLVVRCNESYTSKTCPHCGKIHEKLGGSKVFKCPNCGYTAPRDWVGARNIMLRALQATAVVFQDNAILFQSV
ncbi:MAG: transposase [Limnospira sp. PMC 1291.21]|uniref:RNA-guided endonuclease InsQ/TnpB family protein n=1 Tax=Limnospira sp. PMC 1291.21 TaxID=2981074 RepID=UPI0028E13AEF|nr:transposase [Limnospira sp. PMC 1291.21]MDT9307728.1 transposase [Limnospira sp. PMC 1291.21]